MGMLNRHKRVIEASSGFSISDVEAAVDITDASEIYVRTASENFASLESTLASVVSPYKLAFYECESSLLEKSSHCGVGFLVADYSHHSRARLREIIQTSFNILNPQIKITDDVLNAKYFQVVFPFYEIPSGFRQGSWFFFCADEYGKIIPNSLVRLYSNQPDDKERDNVRLIHCSLLFAMSLLHCKNVHIDSSEPKRPAFAYPKKQKKPFVKYKTLVVEPFRKILETEGDIEHNGLKKALHLCRGHFRTYDETSKLFGRLTGTYWISSHVRGSKEVGEIKKDYRLKV